MKVYTSQPSRRQVSRLIKSANGYSEKTAPFSTPSVKSVTLELSGQMSAFAPNTVARRHCQKTAVLLATVLLS